MCSTFVCRVPFETGHAKLIEYLNNNNYCYKVKNTQN